MELALIFPHQLFRPHPALAGGRPVLLIEDPLIFGTDTRWPLRVHKQKLVLHRASMRVFQGELEQAGHSVRYAECPATACASTDLWGRQIPRKVRSIFVCDPADDVLGRRLVRFAAATGRQLHLLENPNFLSPPDFLHQHLAGKRRPFMARFYEAQRKRLRILTDDDGQPAGGRWSFDEENRKPVPKGYAPPPEPRAPSHPQLAAAIRHVERRFPNNPGSLDGFRWPVERSAARTWLDRFFSERFEHFGAYEDAIHGDHAFLHHAAITPMLNIGLLTPAEIIDRALDHARRHPTVPINSLEGFVRQVIGWREFMHGVYRHHGTRTRNGNFWNFTRPMPAAFYDGTTGIPPVDRVIRQVLREGWCHHIERLMVLGNFMLLCRIRPDDVYRWFMELFIDAYDWVMVPNVYGMSQFADGGLFTTKPYLSGSNYIRRMSDEKPGDWCAVWDALFWTFIADHREFFLRNPRLSMMARNLDRMAAEKQSAHHQTAATFLESLDTPESRLKGNE